MGFLNHAYIMVSSMVPNNFGLKGVCMSIYCGMKLATHACTGVWMAQPHGTGPGHRMGHTAWRRFSNRAAATMRCSGGGGRVNRRMRSAIFFDSAD